jgi:4'-phosphopantetheinyl transferase
MRGPGHAELGGREVHLWTVRLQATEAESASLLSSLSQDERVRAERFHFARHRRAFVLGRAVLRALVGSYLGIAPPEVAFTYGSKGKPALPDIGSPLRFNASNSSDLAAYAFTQGCEIGVDIEQSRRLVDMEDIAARFFAPEEASELMQLSEAERSVAFFNCWTRKEAYIKAVGDGLSVPLDSFRVSLRPGVAPEIVSLGGSAEAAACWTLQEFTPGEDYVGAVAYPGRPRLLAVQTIASVTQLLEQLD